MPIPTTLLHHEHQTRPAVNLHAFHRLSLEAHAAGNRDEHRRRFGACAVALSFALVLVLWSAGSALAGTAILSITDSAGKVDPAAGIPRVVRVIGNAGIVGEAYVNVKYRRSGGAPCAPSPETDSGRYVFSSWTVSGTSMFETPIRSTTQVPTRSVYG